MIVIYESVRLDHPFSIATLLSDSPKSVLVHRILDHRPIDSTDKSFLVRKSNVLNIVDDSNLKDLREVQNEFSKMYWELEELRKETIKLFKEKK